MENIVTKLKILINKLERALFLADKEQIRRLAEEIELLSAKLVAKSDNSPAMLLEQEQTKTNKVINLKSSVIAERDFLYKPVMVADPYQGDYLLGFARERSRDLKEAGVFDSHNHFWQDYDIVRANVFGCLPFDLIMETGLALLEKRGWLRARAKYLQIENKCSTNDLTEQLMMKYNAYIIVKDKQSAELCAFAFDWSF